MSATAINVLAYMAYVRWILAHVADAPTLIARFQDFKNAPDFAGKLDAIMAIMAILRGWGVDFPKPDAVSATPAEGDALKAAAVSANIPWATLLEIAEFIARLFAK